MLTETITWIPVSAEMPDADLTVLITVSDAAEPAWLGYWDGETWRDVDGMPVSVTHWAAMFKGAAA